MLSLLGNASLFVGLLQNGYITKTMTVSCNVDELYLNYFFFSLPGRDQESCQCYFTVAAVPSLAPCKPCRDTRIGENSLKQ